MSADLCGGPESRTTEGLSTDERVRAEDAIERIAGRPWRRRQFRRDPVGTVDKFLSQEGGGCPQPSAALTRAVVDRLSIAVESTYWEVENRSRWRVCLQEHRDQDGKRDDLVLAPLERRLTNVHPRELYPIRVLIRHHIIGVRPHRSQALGPSSWVWGVTLALIAAMVGVVLAAFVGDWARTGEFFAVTSAVVGILLLVGLGGLVVSTLRSRRIVARGPGDPDGYQDGLLEAPTQRESLLRLSQSMAFVGVVVISVGGMGAGLYYGSDLGAFTSFAPDGFRLLADGPDERYEVFGRTIQLIYGSLLAMIPALLFFVFDRQLLAGIRDRWVRDLFRLHPDLWTISDVESAYGRRLDDALSGARPDGRMLGGRRTPILVATVFLTLGWILLLVDTDIGRSSDGVGAAIQLITPTPSIVGFAFLGSYFFAIQLVLRGFIRRDLRPRTYTTITIRLVVSVLIAYLVLAVDSDEFISDRNWGFFLFFLIGVIPQTVLRRLGDFFFAKVPQAGINLGRELEGRRLGLTKLGGIDIYERTRLFNSGVDNIETLVKTDVVDLMVQTRFAAGLVVDWVDQAVLILHVPRLGESEATQAGPVRGNLEKLGIRTASQLVDRYEEATSDGPLDEARRRSSHETLVRAFSVEGVDDAEFVLRGVVASIDAEPTMQKVRAWKRHAADNLGQRAPEAGRGAPYFTARDLVLESAAPPCPEQRPTSRCSRVFDLSDRVELVVDLREREPTTAAETAP
ncbi:MAG: hypothetical protein AAGA99_07380 [Actinomycetota bacterium]